MEVTVPKYIAAKTELNIKYRKALPSCVHPWSRYMPEPFGLIMGVKI